MGEYDRKEIFCDLREFSVRGQFLEGTLLWISGISFTLMVITESEFSGNLVSLG